NNKSDDAAFERIVNTPTRGIGERTMQQVRIVARTHGLTLWDASQGILANKGLSARAANALQTFIGMIQEGSELIGSTSIVELLEHAYEVYGLMEHYQKEKGERGRARIENLKELINAASEFSKELEEDEPELDPLSEFLSYSALEAGEGQADPGEDCVQMMTLHSAKGLEFPLVFIVGMEEGLFPHELSLQDDEGTEEERRLCYVGMTRARQQLYLTCAEQRRMYGRESFAHPSRFLNEVPKHLMEEVRPRASVSLPIGSRFHNDDYVTQEPAEFSIGQMVNHPTFGTGVLLNYEGNGAHARVEVNFQQAGRKWLVLAYANLQTI
ncbi:MAG: ATP-binding domain-containing protein, partial [Gammaproteobacteria bacterium]|nr:ATP-binding domain-containing protein [Gammaproteobacteria bacterium]